MKPMIYAPIGVGWGTTNIPEEKWIDPSKKYRTRDGHQVVGLVVSLFRDDREAKVEITYPVKGSVVMGKGKQPVYRIWALDGRHFLFAESKWDLHEDKR